VLRTFTIANSQATKNAFSRQRDDCCQFKEAARRENPLRRDYVSSQWHDPINANKKKFMARMPECFQAASGDPFNPTSSTSSRQE